ncbi:MAG TPA: hypothetical protein VKQ06_03145, partial [Gammaproteobacteria bacterium]|nr:hypothetical protein [Gammaproteobacteria bacterium]
MASSGEGKKKAARRGSEKKTAKRASRGRKAKAAPKVKPARASQPSAVQSRPRNRQIVVLGMHRSGTSALTGALAGMGVHVGDTDELTPTSWENPRGFFERRDARKICDTLLHESGADWWKVSSFNPDNANFESLVAQRAAIRALVEQLNEHGTWALKEPRLCFLLPIFLSALNDPLAIIAIRHPVESARSLRRRNGFPIQAGLALWEAYTTALLRTGLSMDHVFVDFQSLIERPGTTLTGLADELSSRGIRG